METVTTLKDLLRRLCSRVFDVLGDVRFPRSQSINPDTVRLQPTRAIFPSQMSASPYECQVSTVFLERSFFLQHESGGEGRSHRALLQRIRRRSDLVTGEFHLGRLRLQQRIILAFSRSCPAGGLTLLGSSAVTMGSGVCCSFWSVTEHSFARPNTRNLDFQIVEKLDVTFSK